MSRLRWRCCEVESFERGRRRGEEGRTRRQPKVDELELRLGVGAQHQIGRLDVAMHDARHLVEVREREGELPRPPPHLGDGHGLAEAQPEVAARQLLHDEEAAAPTTRRADV